MEEACVLAEELHEGATIEVALASFVKRRKPRVEFVQQQSSAVPRSDWEVRDSCRWATPARRQQECVVSLATEATRSWSGVGRGWSCPLSRRQPRRYMPRQRAAGRMKSTRRSG